LGAAPLRLQHADDLEGHALDAYLPACGVLVAEEVLGYGLTQQAHFLGRVHVRLGHLASGRHPPFADEQEVRRGAGIPVDQFMFPHKLGRSSLLWCHAQHCGALRADGLDVVEGEGGHGAHARVGAPLVVLPGRMMMRFEPMVAIWSEICLVAGAYGHHDDGLRPMPIMMPSMVRKERMRFTRRARAAILMGRKRSHHAPPAWFWAALSSTMSRP